MCLNKIVNVATLVHYQTDYINRMFFTHVRIYFIVSYLGLAQYYTIIWMIAITISDYITVVKDWYVQSKRLLCDTVKAWLNSLQSFIRNYPLEKLFSGKDFNSRPKTARLCYWSLMTKMFHLPLKLNFS